MTKISRRRVLAMVPLLGLLGAGCGGGGAARPPDPEEVVVVGTVTAIEDLVPVDGGVTIDLVLEEGGVARLLFPSLFRYPPPSEEEFRLYERVRTVAVGDRLRAKGRPTEEGIELTDVEILGHGS